MSGYFLACALFAFCAAHSMEKPDADKGPVRGSSAGIAEMWTQGEIWSLNHVHILIPFYEWKHPITGDVYTADAQGRTLDVVMKEYEKSFGPLSFLRYSNKTAEKIRITMHTDYRKLLLCTLLIGGLVAAVVRWANNSTQDEKNQESAASEPTG